MNNADNTIPRTETPQRKRAVLLCFVKKYRLVASLAFLFGLLLYSLMMSQQLTNTFDGLWQQNYHYAGNAELTSGRWLLIVVDKVVMGLHADPITSIVALSLFIIGFLVVLDLCGAKNNVYCFLCLLLFISSTVISNTLSYRFTSIGYGLAFLLAVLGVYAVIKIKNKYAAVIVSGVFLSLSISCYQAYLSVFCVTAVFYIIFLCHSSGSAEGNGKSIFCTLLRMGCSLITGAVLYVGSLFVFLKIFHTSLSGYNGIGEVTFWNLLADLPLKILKTYQYFGAFFFMDKLKTNRLQPFGIFYLLFAVIAVLVVVIAVRAGRTKKRRIGMLLLSVTVIPVACNAYMLIVGDKLELQMAAGLTMVAPLTLLLAFSNVKRTRVLKYICVIFSVTLLYGNAMQVWFDQEAMYEGRNACETMTTQVICDLKTENLLSSDYEYFFVGVPAKNPFFSVSDGYDRANGYAQMGNFWTSGNCSQMSYNGLIQNYMGLNLPISGIQYESLADRINMSEMPEFPNDGYITLIDNHIVVIKISDYSAYTGLSKYVIE